MKKGKDIRVNNILKIDNAIFRVLKAEHYNPSEKACVMKMKMQNIETGQVVNDTILASDMVEDVRLDSKKMQYSYNTGDMFVFMDTETYEQLELTKQYLGDTMLYIKEEDMIDVQFYNGKPVNIDLPPSVELKIEYTEPAVQGNTGSKVMKEAKMETGLTTQVPLFCHIGDVIKVDTKTGEYAGR